MKNLMKIFFAVAAGVFALACTTDATDDLGVQVGNGVNGATVELSLSLEESRTQLGEKVDGLYSIYWSAGDKISVNGVESGEAIINQSNPASAVFAVAEADTYAVAYPAAPAGKVLFAEKQSHVAEGNTFASGVSTMYGYGESVSNIQLNHLTGVLKIGVKGEAVLAKAQISTVDRAPIAGAFDINFETGELTAGAASKEVIEYSFGEGLQLTAEAQYIHVAVPAGKYEELYITLYEKGKSGNVMYATVKAGESKPLVAGNVREFKNELVYVPNAQLFVIDSAAKLAEFKAAVEAEGGLDMDAIFTEDIDMTGVEWTPIEGYSKTVLGNGYAIKGLTAPLFGTTTASIKGLHIKDVNLSTNNIQDFGALACKVQGAEGVTPKIENCSVSGTITVNNPELTASGSTNAAGVVGRLMGGDIDSCVNNANITIVQPNGGTDDVHIGGVVAIMDLEGSTFSNMYNCVNNGTIDFQPTAAVGKSMIGGVLAVSGSTNLSLNMANCENNGDITVKATTTTTFYLGGISGYNVSDNTGLIQDVTNNGKLTIKEGSSFGAGIVYLGGVFGNSSSCSIERATNNGEIDWERGALFQEIDLGGVIGCNIASNSKKDFNSKYCVNNGDIKFGGDQHPDTKTTFKIGGISGYAQARFYYNINNGDITISGNLAPQTAAVATFKSGTNSIAGIVGYKTEGRMYGCENYGDLIISANLTDRSTSLSQVNIAGIAGYLSTGINASVEDQYTSISKGKITVSGTTTCLMCVGGAISHTYASQEAETSETKIEISGSHTGGLIVGGVIATTGMTNTNLTFNGSIDIKEGTAISGACWIGGCIGVDRGLSTTQRTINGLTNNGNINFGATVTDCVPYIAGCIATGDIDESVDNVKAINISNLVNNGNVTFAGSLVDNGKDGLNIYVSGCTGSVYGTVTTAENNGTVTFAGDTSAANKNTYISGVVGYGKAKMSGLVNNGEVKSGNGAGYKELRLSGTVSYIVDPGSIENCVNNGAITHAVTTGEALKTTRLAGIGHFVNGTVTNCYNTGKISSSGNATTLTLDGLLYDCNGKVTNCYNTGNIEMTGTASGTTAMDGLVYSPAKAVEGCYNTGNFTMSGNAGTLYINGLCGEVNGDMTNCYNGEKGSTTKGAISFTGNTTSGRLYLSGVVYNPQTNVSSTVNYAPILMAGSTYNTMHIGGISASFIQDGYTWTECVNYGDITMSGIVGDADLGGASGSDSFAGGLCECNAAGENGVTLVRCQNHGDVVFTETFKSANAVRASGLFPRQENKEPATLEDCWNSGDVIFNGTASHRTSGVLKIGGCLASASSNAHTVKGTILNTGNVSIGGSNNGNTMLGGVYAECTLAMKMVEGETEAFIINTGNVSFTGSITGYVYQGGVGGRITNTVAEGISFINTGNITLTGTTTAESYAGGVAGLGGKPYANAQSFCTLDAADAKGFTGVGLIMGSAYAADATEVKAGGIGGTVIVDKIEDNDPSGDVIYLPNKQTITAENYHKFIYGAEVTAEVAAACSVLTEAPTVTLPAMLSVTE